MREPDDTVPHTTGKSNPLPASPHPKIVEFAGSKGLPIELLEETSFQYNARLERFYYDWTGPGSQRTIGKRIRAENPAPGESRFKWSEKDFSPDWPFCVPSVWDRGSRELALVVEGETDTMTAAAWGIPALGTPGATFWKPEWWEYLRGFERVVVVVEPDPGGVGLLKAVAGSRPIGAPPLYAVAPKFRPWNCKDLNDLHLSGFGPADLADMPAWQVITADPADRRGIVDLIAQRLENSRRDGDDGDYKALCPFHEDTDGNNFDFGPNGGGCFNPGCPSMESLPPGKTMYDWSFIVRLAAMLGIALVQTEEPTGRLITAHDFLQIDMPPRQWFWDGILWKGALGVIGARAKHGKSTLCLHLLRALAEGSDFLGRPTSATSGVYLNFELADDLLQELLRDILRDAPPEAMSRIHISQELSCRAQGESIPTFIERLGDFIPEDTGLAVIDTARGAFRLEGEAEYRPGDVGAMLRGLGELAHRRGIAILVVHHFRKGATGDFEDISGSGEWLASPDVMLSWSAELPEDDDALIVGELRVLGRIKPVKPITVSLSPKACVTCDQKTVVRLTDQERLVLAWIDKLGEATVPDVACSINCSERTVDRHVKRLLIKGVIYESGTKTGPGAGKPAKCYSSMPKGSIEVIT